MINRDLITVKNLAVYLIEGEDRLSRKYVTLEEAMDRQLIVLRETGDVGELAVDNPSDKYVFIMSGDIVRGGRQDRTIADDIILKPKSMDVPLKSFCVEQSRWHRRGGESDRFFSASKKGKPSRDIALAVRSKNQSEVWSEVERFQICASAAVCENVRSSESESSLELTLDNDKLKSAVKEYLDVLRPAFEARNSVTGFAYSINGRISMSESFGSAALFRQLRDKLLESAANEAVLKSSDKTCANHPTVEDVTNFLIAAKGGSVTIRNTGEITLEKRYDTPQSILYKTFHVEADKEEKVHTVAYNTCDREAGRSNSEQRFRYGGVRR